MRQNEYVSITVPNGRSQTKGDAYRDSTDVKLSKWKVIYSFDRRQTGGHLGVGVVSKGLGQAERTSTRGLLGLLEICIVSGVVMVPRVHICVKLIKFYPVTRTVHFIPFISK